jgi:hypothetical protein
MNTIHNYKFEAMANTFSKIWGPNITKYPEQVGVAVMLFALVSGRCQVWMVTRKLIFLSFSWLCSVPPHECQDSILIRPWLLPPRFLPIHHSLTILLSAICSLKYCVRSGGKKIKIFVNCKVSKLQALVSVLCSYNIWADLYSERCLFDHATQRMLPSWVM